ncbi:hypothetical protein SAMN05444157_1254 [Frankineae bacterium MT45]|nr:hypothetical protein SAMN05444157_1254 [Frankineae bacterium MT45]
MAVRLLADLIIGLGLFVLFLVIVYRWVAARNDPSEKDVSLQPSVWCVDTRAVANGMQTEFGIVRVAEKSGEILERRIMGRIRNDLPDYTVQLDAAQDRAYEAMRVANVGLRRR